VDSRKIGDGKPGKITMRIKEEYKKLVNSTGTPIYE
ncbi:MAG: branched-chain amino acid aminotransferase, partial [Euryarchaeota archaeon CG01_land_8_20_14_3_00_38_12]